MKKNYLQLNRWSSSLRELYYHGKSEEVLKQYHNRLTSLSNLSVQTYSILFKAYTLTRNWSEGQQVHARIKTDVKLYQDQRLKIASR